MHTASYCWSVFNFLRNSQTAFHHSCAILHLTSSAHGSQCGHIFIDAWDFLFDFSFSFLPFFFLLITATLTSVNWHLVAAVIYISLTTNDVRHLFMCLFGPLHLIFVQNYFSYFSSFAFLYKFWNNLVYSYKDSCWNFGRNCIKSMH